MTSLGIDIGGSSIKLAKRRDGQTVWTHRSRAYERPNRAELVEVLRDAVREDASEVHAIGLCVPGILDHARRCVTLSINLPGLVDMPLDTVLAQAIRPQIPQANLLTDAEAAARDIYTARNMTGRLLLLVLGTGVGAAVWDNGGALYVDGDSPGHFGQMDVSVAGDPILGPDGGQGSLEGYIGAAALRNRYGDKGIIGFSKLSMADAPLRALARAIRIGHAIYRPHHVCLAGGIGNALAPLLVELQTAISLNLTCIARPNWTLTSGDSDFHAAIGAAKAAEG